MLTITDKEFDGIRELLHKKTGVALKESKKPLVISRLRKRLEELNKNSFKDYIALLNNPGSNELEFFINALTTNETFFFRHSNQFNFLYEQALPEMLQLGQKNVTIWSAACSTGEEPYSLTITCKEFFKNHRGKTFKILASDVNTQVMEVAKQGIYSERSVKEASKILKERYFDVIQEDGKTAPSFKIKDEVKKCVEFFQHNLKSPATKKDIDIIFLRNVLIYFEQDVKQLVIQLIEKALRPGGYFMISLSENLNDVDSSLETLRGGIYRKVS